MLFLNFLEFYKILHCKHFYLYYNSRIWNFAFAINRMKEKTIE